MKKIALLCLLLSCLAFKVNAQTEDCSSKSCFPTKQVIGSQELPLLGSVLFKYYFWTAYSIALYGPESARSIDGILADVPKKLVLVYKRDFDAQDFISAADKLLKEDPDANLAKIQPEIDQINKLYQAIKEGDSYSLEYEPGKGTTLSKNGVELGTVPGAEFARVYLGMWLGRNPIDKDMRDALFAAQ